jgi:4-amino-4-deoxy-L-arabinose transferase-like glycosyltransferase
VTTTAPAHATEASSRITLAEWAVAATIVVAALVARLWAFGATGIGHFDEGVYVISALGVAQEPHNLFPNQIVFSPPFYFTAVGAAIWLFGGAADHLAVMVNVVIGAATVAAIWWVGRSWFGPRAGVIAAVLLALSGSHILLSRVALTDAAFSLWFLLSIGAIVLAIDRRDFRLAVLAGMVTGLAWNTKYHGWFALLITGVALAPTLWSEWRSGGWRKALAVWGVASVVAILLYLPWAAYMRGYSGGYGGIVSYYTAMLRVDWLGNVGRHMGQQAFMEGMLSRAAPLAALGAGWLVDTRRAAGSYRFVLVAAALGIGGLLIGQSGVAALLTIAAIPMLLREFQSYRSRVLICWMGLWLVAAPIYHPYARLILPFTIATFLVSGWVIDRAIGHTFARGRAAAALALAGAVLVAILGTTLRSDPGNPWHRSRDVAQAAETIAAQTGQDETIYVVGEPPLVHYLRAAGRAAPSRTNLADLDTLTKPAYLVTGVYTQRAPNLRERVEELRGRLMPIAVLRFTPNDLRLLDDLRPDRARAFRQARDSTFDMTLYRVEPAQPTPQ